MKLRKIYLCVVFVIGFLACSDKMDYHEYTSYEKDHVFTDFGRTAGFVNNIYSYLDSDLPGLNSLASACDEAEMAVNYSTILDYTNGNWSALSPKSQWGYYTAIRAANYFLKESEDLDFYDLRFTQDYEAQMNRFNRYQYEVRLLRAYYYFILVRTYGDVPFTTEVLSEKEANSILRTPYSEVFDFIIKECDDVALELPVTYTGLENDAAGGTNNPETGRVTRGMALALKARASLYRASKLFNEDDNKDLWKDAAQACWDVIDYCDINGITLGKYTDLWGTNNYNASEVIFARRIGDTNSPERENFPIGLENALAGNCPTQTLVDAYEMKDGSTPVLGSFDGRDPRFRMTIAVNGDKWPNSNPNPLETYIGGRNGLPIPYATPTGYYLKKYLDGSIDISASEGTGGKRHSWITFRLGEFYLNYAEAVFRYLGSADATSNEFTMSASKAVNKVRSRSDVKMPDFPMGMNNSEFWERYKRERMVELAFEGHRFWDIRRWKEGGFQKIDRLQIIKNPNESLSYKRISKPLVWEDKMYFYPIPDAEIRKNPNLTQNPGWGK
ncbi:MAG: RagB/SusD family nutrient uptake outer membrane protein [Bacteroidales bacterium]|nr:RagB/SusD family nutrient uptake outer membrane protein [Bacteroidales bacterium]